MVDRRRVIGRAGLGGLAGVFAAGIAPAVHAASIVRWRLASSFPRPLDTIYGGAETFARKVSEMSGGRFQVDVYPAEELMPALAVVDGVEHGTIDACHTASYYFFEKNEAFAVGAAIPFGMNSRQLTAWMYEGNGLSLTREFFAGYNAVNFPCGNTGAQMGGWFRKEILAVEDLQGLKFRIGGFGGRVIQRLGAIPLNIPAGEIYTALETGRIDAAEWIGPYDDYRLGFYKVAPYYYYPGWWEGSLQLDLLVNQKAYNALTTEHKAMVDAASTYAHVDMQARYDARNPHALKQLVGAKAKVLAFPKPVLDASYQAALDVYRDLDDSNPEWKKLYADYRTFQKDQLLWARFAEARFDSYMQGVRL